MSGPFAECLVQFLSLSLSTQTSRGAYAKPGDHILVASTPLLGQGPQGTICLTVPHRRVVASFNLRKC